MIDFLKKLGQTSNLMVLSIIMGSISSVLEGSVEVFSFFHDVVLDEIFTRLYLLLQGSGLLGWFT